MNDAENVPPAVVDLIEGLIKRSDVQSVSFPFVDEGVWRLLVQEQVERAERSGLHRQHAFALSGPDSGLPFDPGDWGGYVHIPYEGMCESDLFIIPKWRGYILKLANGDGDLTAAMFGKQCHYVLLRGEHPEVDSATRTLAGGWTLYTSKRPYQPCHPFLGFTYDPNERPSPHAYYD
jgi:hypothetical protein